MASTVPPESVERLYHLLVTALSRSRAEPFAAPVTVAEIYQELVPYRAVRSEAGFQMNADYEHALLALLSGAGERLRLEPATARDALRRELAAANPNVGRYRDFAACDAWVAAPAPQAAVGRSNRVGERADVLAEDDGGADWGGLAGLGAKVDDEASDAVATAATFPFEPDAAAPTPTPPAPAAAASTPTPPAPAAAASTPTPTPPAPARTQEPARAAAAPVAQEQVPRAAAPAVDDHRCAYCDSSLPNSRTVRFCPYCGSDQTTQPCGSCGEALDPGWVFCVACGEGRAEE
jgi:hypothetical protein